MISFAQNKRFVILFNSSFTFHKLATNHRALWHKVSYRDIALYYCSMCRTNDLSYIFIDMYIQNKYICSSDT